MSPEEIKREELRRKGAKWPRIIGAILASNLLGVGALIYFAHAGSSHSVEPNYYKKAIAWDKEMAQQRENMRLGWKVSLDFTARANARRGRGEAWLVLHVKDSLGRELQGAQIEIEAYAKRMGNRRHQLRPTARKDGSYVAPLRLRPGGLWRFEITVKHRGKRFTARLDEDVPFL